MKKDNNILICTGGTGGHVIPAVNFGNYLILKCYRCSLMLDKRGIKYAKNFIYTDSLNLDDKNTEMPIGVNCRTCDRMDCQQRAFPPLHKKFDIDLNKRGISVYVAD